MFSSRKSSAPAAAGGYNLTNSLRFRSSASAYLNRTPASAGNRKTWTWSGWVKRGALGSFNPLLQANYSGTPWFVLGFANNDKMEVTQTAGSSASWESTAVFRDVSAWYHVVLAVDTTSATSTMNGSSTDRFRLYVNGTQYVISGGSVPSQNADLQVNNTVAHTIGGYGSSYTDGYLAEVNFIDGQALTPSSFGETSSTTGVWIPKKYTGTYGTNGFYLPFTNTASTSTLGNDFSGNGNNWTTNNISLTAGSTYDSMTDVPTLTSATAANYCVLNPLDKGTNNTLSNGNLRYAIAESQQGLVRATVGLPSTGKWYCETTKLSTGTLLVGIATRNAAFGGYLGEDANGWGYFSGDGQVYNNNAGIATGATIADGDVLGIAFNSDSGTLQFYKNGTLQTTTTGFTPSTVQYFFAAGSFGGDGDFNFGQQPWAYTPPSGFIALNTFNLPTPTIGATASTTANKYMNIALYTGNTPSTNAITGLGFAPDLVWTKSRSAAESHNLVDKVRGNNLRVRSNQTDAEASATFTLDSDGFTVGANSESNTGSMVGWAWKANGAGSSNTAGSITSTVSANTTAGFSIVTYTGNGSTGTVGHGLGVAPNMIIIKNRSSAVNWIVYHSSLGNTKELVLNSTAAVDTNSDWNNTSPTSTVFSLGVSGSGNGSGNNLVAYCFAQVAGYSAFGSYVGNGVADGPFIYTGFRPRYFILKNITSAQSWSVQDTSRSPYNVGSAVLLPNSSSAELTGTDFIDIVSNGFKIRHSSSGNNNNSGDTYIYMAFAENPFKYANAR